MIDFADAVLAVVIWAVMTSLPVWFGRRIRIPSADEALLRIPMRPLPRLLVRHVPPAGFVLLGAFWGGLFTLTGARRAGFGGGILGALLGVVSAAPLIAMAWAWLRVFRGECVATREGVYVLGSLIRWQELEIERTSAGLLLERRSRKLLGRNLLPERAWVLDEEITARLRELHTARRGAMTGGHDKADSR